MSTKEPILKSRRRRARRACEPCRQRKRKCDGRDPCRTCVEAEYDCYWQTRSESRRIIPAQQHPLGGHTKSEEVEDGRETHAAAEHGLSDSEMAEAHRAEAILDPTKPRYMMATSAVAFPRILGSELAEGKAPRVHSFAWNLGIRAEPPPIKPDVTRLISLEQAKSLSKVYFAVVHPCFAFLDVETFEQSCTDRWLNHLTDHSMDTIICGVAALGSFFSGNDQALETSLMEHAKEVLQGSSVLYHPGPTHVGAWILRTLYLRLTTRPHASWIASCTAMHISEATGLHIELHKGVSQQNPMDTNSELMRRMFWTSWSLHTILSYEYGRTRIDLQCTCQDPSTHLWPRESWDLLHIARAVARDKPSEDQTTKMHTLKGVLKTVIELNISSEVMSLLRADMVFCVYRHLRLLRHHFTKSQLSDIIKTGRCAIPVAARLAQEYRVWWSVISTPFQFVCVLLAIDSAESLSEVSNAMDKLETINELFDTHMVREATQMAKSLVQMARDRKAEALRKLDCCVGRFQEPDNNNQPPVLGNQAFLDWPEDPYNWDNLFQQFDG